MANIVRTDSVAEVVADVVERMDMILGKDHPKDSVKVLAMRAAQRNAVELFASLLLETWVLPADIQVKDAKIR